VFEVILVCFDLGISQFRQRRCWVCGLTYSKVTRRFDWALIHLVYLLVGALQLSHCSSGRLGGNFLNQVSGGQLWERD